MPGPTGKFAGSRYVELIKEELSIPKEWIRTISTFLLAVCVSVPVYIESSCLGGNMIAIRMASFGPMGGPEELFLAPLCWTCCWPHMLSL